MRKRKRKKIMEKREGERERQKGNQVVRVLGARHFPIIGRWLVQS